MVSKREVLSGDVLEFTLLFIEEFGKGSQERLEFTPHEDFEEVVFEGTADEVQIFKEIEI